MTAGSEPVSTIMSTELYSVAPSDLLKDAKDIITKNAVRHLVVIDENKLVGILSKLDIEKFLLSSKHEYNELQTKLIESIKVGQIMIKNVHTMQLDDTIKEAAEVLSLSSYHALPVMDDEELKGIVTSTDLILYLLKWCKVKI